MLLAFVCIIIIIVAFVFERFFSLSIEFYVDSFFFLSVILHMWPHCFLTWLFLVRTLLSLSLFHSTQCTFFLWPLLIFSHYHCFWANQLWCVLVSFFSCFLYLSSIELLGSIIFIKFRKFPTLISSNIFVLPPSPSKIPITQVLICLKLFHSSMMLCSLKKEKLSFFSGFHFG